MIVTFYSYKGGVGRSMALANLGEWFRLRELRVVMIDWDLEAPGLESFFVATTEERVAIRARLGLLDMISSYKELYASLPNAPQGGGSDRAALADRVAVLDEALPPLAHVLLPLKAASNAPASSGKLWLLTAGCRSEKRFDAYAHTVQQFDWEEFYASYDGEAYFEWLRRQLLDPGLADVVLIDSRTGVAEMSGVCTRQLADVVVMFSAPNDQNLEGVAMMARSFTRPDLIAARGGRGIDLIAVPARVDVSEGRPIDLFEERFRQKLDPYLPETFRRLRTSFGRLRIPYISAYAYAERLAVGDPEGVKSLQEAYATLAAHLVALSPSSSVLRRRCREALQEAFGLPTVLVAALDPADVPLAEEMQRKLDGAGVITVLEQRRADAVLDAAVKADPAVAGSILVAVPASTATLLDRRFARLVRRAREFGMCVFPLVPGAGAMTEPAPKWGRRTRIYDAEHDFAALVPALQSPCRAERAPFMVPAVPARFVGREQEIVRIKALLLDEEVATVNPIALVGLGGVGKSTLARVVCNDEDVIDRFDEGIVWIKLGPQADLVKEIAAVAAAFGEDARAIANVEQAERRLSELVATKRCVVVFDDATASGPLRALPRHAAGARILFTTRTRDVAVEAGATLVDIGPLSLSDAAATVSAGVAGEPIDPELLAKLVHELGGLPLAMELVNQSVRKRVELGDSPSAALADVIERIEEEGLTAIDPGLFADPGRSVFASFMLAAERLEPEDRARLPLLARLPRARSIGAQEIAQACGVSESDAQRLMRRLAAVSLFDYDAASGTVRIPPPVHAYLRSMEYRQRRAESTRIATPTAGGAATGSATASPGAARGGGAGVLICYRRDDTAGYAGRLYDRLTRELGYDRVFMDIDIGDPGADFTSIVESAIANASVMVVVIGPNWLHGSDEQGRRRIDSLNDFVRIEIAAALRRELRVIPVLVGGAHMPAVDDLPADIRPLAWRNALQISDSRFHQDADELVRAVGLATQSRAAGSFLAERRPSAWLRLAAMLAVVIAVISIVFFMYMGRESAPPEVPPEAAALFAQGEDYYFGRNVAQDYKAAAELYRKAAELGFAPAKNSLGRAYENGQGVEKDMEQAIYWYREAANLGHPDAIAALKRLGDSVK